MTSKALKEVTIVRRPEGFKIVPRSEDSFKVWLRDWRSDKRASLLARAAAAYAIQGALKALDTEGNPFTID